MESTTFAEAVKSGLPEMDAEHAFQVQLVDAIAALLRREGASTAEKDEALAQLVDYTRVHFLSEELLMRLHAYPQYAAHSLEHGRLLDRVHELMRDHGAGASGAATDLVSELRTWLTSHVGGPDVAFADWCARNAITPA